MYIFEKKCVPLQGVALMLLLPESPCYEGTVEMCPINYNVYE
jgi:hypothetical protein